MEEEDKYFLKAKKSLGQHFLRSEKALNQMVETIPPDPRGSGVVFEIGPGEGVLTQKLLEKGHMVIVIEIDKRSIEILESKFKNEIENRKLFIINQDCLEVDYASVLASPLFKGGAKGGGNSVEYILLGNIPYYITGAIFRHTFEQKVLPKIATFLIQKEVAQRIVANDKKESILSISIKIFSDQIKLVDVVKAGSFVPPPKVDSAILTIQDIKNLFDSQTPPSLPLVRGGTQQVFFEILRAGFSHKRKFFLSNLKTDLEENLLAKYFEPIKGILMNFGNEKTRAEDLRLDFWKKVVEII